MYADNHLDLFCGEAQKNSLSVVSFCAPQSHLKQGGRSGIAQMGVFSIIIKLLIIVASCKPSKYLFHPWS